jgi:hypothetical protein
MLPEVRMAGVLDAITSHRAGRWSCVEAGELLGFPIYKLLLVFYSFDASWLWTLFLIVATMGGLTPSFGYVLFAMKSAVPSLSMSEIYKASWPFVWLNVFGMFILWLLPPLITFLPNLVAKEATYSSRAQVTTTRTLRSGSLGSGIHAPNS